MRSDKGKKADPNRDIDDFLSRFDDMEDSADISPYLDESEEYTDTVDSKTISHNFHWKEIDSAKSNGKLKSKDSAERMVTKDPAPSAIKVQRLRPDDNDDDVPTYPVDDIDTDIDADDMDITAAEGKLHELLADETEVSESADDDSDISDLAEKTGDNKPESVGFFKGLFSFFSAKSAEPVEIPHPEVDIDADIDIAIDIDKDESEESPDEESLDDNAPDTDTDTDVGIDTDSTDTDTDIDIDTNNTEAAAAVETETDADTANDFESETADAAFSLLNTPKEEKTPLASGDYIWDEESGTYRKTDLGKRKRIEFRDTSSVVYTGLFGRKKKAKKKRIKKSAKEILFCKKNPNYRPDEGATYELDGKIIKNKPLKISFLKIFRDLVLAGLLMVMIACGIAGYIIYKAPSYDFSDIYATVATASVVYDDQGKQIDNIYYTEDRRIVKYEDMPANLIDAFVAIEDKTFWKHHGFNWTRMIGAVISSITGHGQIRGTSTITQQLSRNVYLPEEKSERTIKRKLLEMYYAARIEHALSKEQIVEAYLNTIYLGFGCYGVNSAAKTYFSKSVKDLSLLECAALAALPQAPHNYALLKNANEYGEVSEDSKVIAKYPDRIVTNDISKSRRDLTLDLMLEQGLITQQEYDASHSQALNDFIKPTLKSGSGNYSYFHEYLIDTIVADLMEQKDISKEVAERMVYTGGLQIYSTMDSQAQNVIANEFKEDDNFPAVSAIWKQDEDDNILNNSGKIALYDYDDYFDKDDNFRLSSENGDIVFHDDGSATINKGHNLYIYETEVDGATDYSIEFKEYYIIDDGILYSIQGGYVNIPAAYKSSDGNGNVNVSADFFSDANFTGSFKRIGKDLVISDAGYTIGRRVRQPQGSMVIVQVGTGEVKAMVGGRQFSGERLLNRAINPRQPGSSIKPLAVYGAALQKSYELQKDGKKWKYTDHKIDRQGTKGWGDYVTCHSSIEDERTRINGKYWPKNVTGGYSGKNNFRTAIQQSINTCAVKLMMQVSAEYAYKQLEKFGISTLVSVEDNNKVNDVNTAAMALGAMTEGVTPLEMALAYASFPGGGKLNSPICYTKILNRNGDVLLEGESVQTEALNEGVAWIMTDVLKSVVSRGIAWNAAIEDVDVGGKTGTTNDQYDVWFDGFTPSYAAALWIGTDNNVEMNEMSSAATRLWSKIMNQIPRAKKGKYKKQPSSVIVKGGEYYTKGTEVGLASWSYAEMKKKARDAAYKKWKAEREKHKKWVVDKKPQKIYEDRKVYVDESELDKYSDKGLQIEGDTGRWFYIERIDTGKMTKEKGHWEYEKGWRDGDFKYTFDGKTYRD